jgi:hypothetical protein
MMCAYACTWNTYDVCVCMCMSVYVCVCLCMHANLGLMYVYACTRSTAQVWHSMKEFEMI